MATLKSTSAVRPWVAERKAHARRTVTNKAIYKSSQWVNLARKHKMLNPLCVGCEAKGFISPVEVTDHITPINQGGLPFSWDNLQSLCHRCHNAKSGAEARQKISDAK